MELADQTHLWNNSINSARPLFPCSLCHCAKTQGIARICCIPSSEQLHPSSSHGFCGSGYAACEQEGAQMKGFLSGFILMGDTIAIFYSASQPLALLQPTRILVLQNPSVPVPYNSSRSLKSSGKAKERFIFKFFSRRTFLVQFGLVFKGGFSHPLTFLGAGDKKNPHFRKILWKCWSIMKLSGHPALSLECHSAQEDGKPTGTWGFMNGFKWVRIQGHIPS